MQDNTEKQSEQIELLSFPITTILRDVVKRWRLIVFTAVLAGIIAYVASDLLYTPTYSTTTTFVVSARGSSTTVYQNLSATSNLATVFSEVLNSSILQKKVLATLGMASFDGKISASAIAETNLLTLRVTASDPRTAFLVMRAIIENHQIVSYQVLGDTILEVLQNPTVPVAPVNPIASFSYMKKAAFLAAAAMCLLLAFLSYRRDTVRSRQEAEKKLDCHVLTEIGHERKYKTLGMMLRRRKTSILITNPATSFQFVETIRKLRRRVEQLMPADGGVLMVTSVMENEGKSTVAANLALAMAQKNKRVLLIDCDLRKPACYKILHFPWRRSGTIDVATGKAGLEDSIMQMEPIGLCLLLERRSLRSSTEISGSEGMAQLLEKARNLFDYVVVDTPPMSVAPDAECIMELTDASLLVVQQNVVKADGINRAIRALQGAKSKLIGCVINNVYELSLTQGSGYGYGYGYGYGRYGKYGKYGKYGNYNRKDTTRQSEE